MELDRLYATASTMKNGFKAQATVVSCEVYGHDGTCALPGGLTPAALACTHDVQATLLAG